MRINMKKIIIIITPILLISLAGCLKDTPLNDFGSTAKPIVEYGVTSSGHSHGLEGFASDAVLAAGQPSPYMVPLVVNIASVYPLTQDLKVTLAVDDNLRTEYNAANAGGVQYEVWPDSTYSFAVTQGTIKAGSRLDTFWVSFYSDKIDYTKNYMLPIKIADASGQAISGNFSVAYLHLIGNPLAGAYTWDFYRWNTQDGSGSLSGASFFGATVTFLPDDATTVEMPTGYFTQPNYVLTFDNNGGVLSNFAVAPSAAMSKSFSDNGITIVDAPSILLADPVAGHFKIHMVVFNGTAFR